VGALVVFVRASLRWVITRRGEWRAWRASCTVRSRASLLFKQWKRSWKCCVSEQHQQIFHHVRLLCSDRVRRRSTGGRHSGFTLTSGIRAGFCSLTCRSPTTVPMLVASSSECSVRWEGGVATPPSQKRTTRIGHC
jgi:hypothetical protein